MKLPNSHKASISKRKITAYLLSLTHEEGKSKAKFFRGIGFNETNIDKFEQALLKIGKSNKVMRVDKTKSEYVVKYIIEGFIDSPKGKRYKITTVWAIKTENTTPQLVSAYPGV